MFAVQADGCEVLTVEGLARDGALHPLQQAFSDQQGLQCGYCTPGMLLRSLELLRDDPTPSRDRIREGIASQLCRCTGYQFIVDAVVQAAQDMAAEATHQRGPTPLPQEA
jgi:carbon-monoxide dehydrogenase small subunit